MTKLRNVLRGALLAACAASSASAASIVVSAPGGSDASIIANVVATPDDGPRTLNHNPAGVTLVRGTELTYSLLAAPVSGRYSNRASGYDGKSDELALLPCLWVGTDALDPWYAGVGLSGTVGSTFAFPGNPSAGFPNRFLAESSVAQGGLVLGREIAPGIRAGVELSPSFSRAKARFPTPLGPVRYDLDGFGVGGAVGLLYEASDRLSLGVGYKAPGRVWMSGDADVGMTDDEVDFVFHVPQQVEFGLAYHVTPDTLVAAQARWTDYTDFEGAKVDFRRTNALDSPFIASAHARFRWGAGIETMLTESSAIRFGFSHEPWMMDPKSLSPLLYDGSDWYLGTGVIVRLTENWKLTGVITYVYSEDRVVTAEDQKAFPGRYEFAIPITVGFQIDYRFSGAPAASPSPARSASSRL